MKLKSVCAAVVLLISLFGCSKNALEESKSSEITLSDIEPEEAVKDFAAILSKAVSSDKDLRLFIKEVALKKIDRDYDVFYPYVKSEIVSEGKTFRDILIHFSDSEEQFEAIERSLPLLTILVPDWSLMGCFSIKDWNPEEKGIAVGYETVSDEKPLFADGEIIGVLPEGAIPAFPTLIVKNSDRIKLDPHQTKASGEYQYDYIDDAFNPAFHPETKVEHTYSEVLIDGTPDISNFLPESEVPEILKDAYEKLSDESTVCQRDYIFYGILPDNPVGKYNNNRQEYIHKLKLKTYTDEGCLTDGDDFIPASQRWEYKENKSPKNAEQLRNHFYSDGGIELNLRILIPYKNGTVYQTNKVISANFSDIFAIDHADLDYRHRTWFCRDWYVYTIEDRYIVPKWFTVDIDLPLWNLTSESDIISIYIEEIDPDEETEKDITIKYNESTTTSISGNAGLDIDTTANITGGVTVEHSESESTEKIETIKITTSKGSDDLGTIELRFTQPVIEGKGEMNGENGYFVHVSSTGTVDMMFLSR